MNKITDELERLIGETIRLQEECQAVIDEAKQLLVSYYCNCNHSETEE